MQSLHCLSLCTLSPPRLHPVSKNKPLPATSAWLGQGYGHVRRKRASRSQSSSSSSSCIVRAVDKESQQFEIDPDKAKEALEKLDQQLQALSKKKVSPPKIKALEVKLTRDVAKEEEVQEISGSALAYAAAALFLFTIFYNVLFYTVIKPSIDGPEDIPATIAVETRSPEAAVLQFLRSIPEVFPEM